MRIWAFLSVVVAWSEYRLAFAALSSGVLGPSWSVALDAQFVGVRLSLHPQIATTVFLILLFPWICGLGSQPCCFGSPAENRKGQALLGRRLPDRPAVSREARGLCAFSVGCDLTSFCNSGRRWIWHIASRH